MTAAAVPVPVGPPAAGVPHVAPDVVAPELLVADVDDAGAPEEEELELEVDLMLLAPDDELELAAGPELALDGAPEAELAIGLELALDGAPEVELAMGPELEPGGVPALALEDATIPLVEPPPAPPAAMVDVAAELDASPLADPTLDAVPEPLTPVPGVPLLDVVPVSVPGALPPVGPPTEAPLP